MRVAVVTHGKYYLDRMDQGHRALMETLEAHPAFRVFDLDRETESQVIHALSSFDILYNDDWVNWDRRHPAVLRHPALLVGKFYEDIHAVPRLDGAYDFHVSRYSCPMASRFPDFGNVFHLRHHYDTRIYREWGLPKSYDVLIYGNLDTAHYPLRSRVARLLMASPGIGTIKVLGFPGYENSWRHRLWRSLTGVRMVRNEDLSRELNRSRTALVAPNEFDYFVKKYGEAALSGAALLGQVPREARAFLGDDIVELHEGQSDSEILDTVARALAGPELLAAKAARLARRFRERYCLERYPQNLLQIMTWARARADRFDHPDVEFTPENRPIL